MNHDEGRLEVCGNCKYWQDYKDRVFAMVKGVTNERHDLRGSKGYLELRNCKYRPAPTVSDTDESIYTDEKFTCSCFKATKKKDDS